MTDMRVRAEALFLSALQPSERHTGAEVRAAVEAVLARATVAECAELFALEYGDHEVASAERMRWALQAVRAAYAPAPV